MKISLFILSFLTHTLCSFSQEKEFSSFELLYAIPQEMHHSDWPNFNVGTARVFNDTLFTIMCMKNYVTAIPLQSSDPDQITHLRLNPPKDFGLFSWYKYKNKQFILSSIVGLFIQDKNDTYQKFTKEKIAHNPFDLFFIEDRILVYSYGSEHENYYELYDLNGHRLDSAFSWKYNIHIYAYPYQYQNKIMDGYCQATISNDKIDLTVPYNADVYGDTRTFVGGCRNLGFFVDWELKNKLVVRNLDDQSVVDEWRIPVRIFSPNTFLREEGFINLRVFSEDNNTYYFVFIKYDRLMVYKATR